MAEEVPVDAPGIEGESAECKSWELGVLGAAWENCKLLRRRSKEEKMPYMTRWLNEKAINVASVKAMVLNETALVCLAKVWCPLIEYPKAVPIGLLRKEVWSSYNSYMSYYSTLILVFVIFS